MAKREAAGHRPLNATRPVLNGVRPAGRRDVAVCYIRKSLVRAGAVDPISPEYQRSQLEAFCVREKLKAEFHVDADGHRSGLKANRPGWITARRRILDGDVAALVVVAYDRAARSVRELLDVVDVTDEAKVRFVSLTDLIDTSTPEGRMQLSIVATGAEYYARKAGQYRKRAIDGLRRERGRHYGLAPFGTERVVQNGDRVLVPSQRQQRLGSDVDALIRCYQFYTVDRLSYHATTRAMNAEGWQYRTREGDLRAWTYDDVRRVIQSHWVYAGYVTIGRAYRDMTEVISGSHAPIIPSDLTNAAAEMLRGHRLVGPRTRAPNAFPLTGLVRCVCGHKLIGSTIRDVRSYRGTDRCPDGRSHVIPANLVEAYVRDRIANFRFPSKIARSSDDTVARAILFEARSATDDVQQTKEAIDRLADLYASGDLTKDEYRKKRSEYEARLPKAEDAGPVPATIPTFVDVVLECGPDLLRDFANNMIERVQLDGRVPKVVWRDWCQAGAPKDRIDVADI